MLDTVLLIIGALTGGGGLGAVLVWHIKRRPAQIRGELKIVTSASALVDQMQKQLNNMLERIDSLEQEREDNRRVIAALRESIFDKNVEIATLRQRVDLLTLELDQYKQRPSH